MRVDGLVVGVAGRIVERLHARRLISSSTVGVLAAMTPQARDFDELFVRLAVAELAEECLFDDPPMRFFDRVMHDGLRHDLLVTRPAADFVTPENVQMHIDCLRSIAAPLGWGRRRRGDAAAKQGGG